MPFRFRRSFRILPERRLNVSKSGETICDARAFSAPHVGDDIGEEAAISLGMTK